MELLNAFQTVTPPLDAIQEVRVSTNNAEATVGTYGGAQVNAFIKSGTNQLHGSAYEFYRGDALNAFQWRATTKAPYRGNQFGGSFGWSDFQEQGILLRGLSGPPPAKRHQLHPHSSNGSDEARDISKKSIPQSDLRSFDTEPIPNSHSRSRGRLTLNMALRWDLITPAIGKGNHQSDFDVLKGVLDLAASGNRGPNVITYYGGYSPRVGFAYSPNNGKSAVSAAFGITYFPGNFGAIGGFLERNFPFFEVFNNQSQFSNVPLTPLSVSGLPVYIPTPTTAPVQPPPGVGVSLMSKRMQPDLASLNVNGRLVPADTASNAVGAPVSWIIVDVPAKETVVVSRAR